MAKQIISASRRTDIPAFYSEWFMNRVRAGTCRVINPLYPEQKTLPVDLSPGKVECVVFWTRNPLPLIPHLDELDAKGYCYYFLYTIIGYPKVFDPASPEAEEAVATFQALSRRLGTERVIWRYDPIVLTQTTPIKWHQQQIRDIAARLQTFTHQMIFSFVIDYGHARIRYQKVKDQGVRFLGKERLPFLQEELAQWIGRTMPEFGIQPFVCAERHDWSSFGVHKAHCVDRTLIDRLSGEKRKYRKDPAQRVECCCTVSRDIGENNTCPAGCFYCYASKSDEEVRRSVQRHDPFGEYLVGPAVSVNSRH